MSNEWDSVAALRRTQIESGKDLTFSRVFVPLFRELVDTLKPKSILEAGIGTGHLTHELSVFSPRYLGIEPSDAMFRQATDVLKGRRVQLIKSSLEDLDIKETFDLVLVHLCLQTIEDHVAFLATLQGFLSSGGAFLISIPHPAFFNDYKRVVQTGSFPIAESMDP